jgi:predicted aspartyl protease
MFLKGKVYKHELLCLLDTRASHIFVTRNNAEKMELQLEEFKAPVEVHFVDGVPHPITLQARDVPLQLGNWKRKVDLLVFILGEMGNAFWGWNSSPITMCS